jgi:hypothetical protein
MLGSLALVLDTLTALVADNRPQSTLAINRERLANRLVSDRCEYDCWQPGPKTASLVFDRTIGMHATARNHKSSWAGLRLMEWHARSRSHWARAHSLAPNDRDFHAIVKRGELPTEMQIFRTISRKKHAFRESITSPGGWSNDLACPLISQDRSEIHLCTPASRSRMQASFRVRDECAANP